MDYTIDILPTGETIFNYGKDFSAHHQLLTENILLIRFVGNPAMLPARSYMEVIEHIFAQVLPHNTSSIALIIDLQQVQSATHQTRKYLIGHLRQIIPSYKIVSVGLIAASIYLKTLISLPGFIPKKTQLRFFKDTEEALSQVDQLIKVKGQETVVSSPVFQSEYDSSWENAQVIYHQGKVFNIEHYRSWAIDSPDYTLRVYLIAGEILFMKDQGKVTAAHMEKAYDIFRQVLEHAGNKPLFFIGDISDLLFIPRSARRVMEEHENHFKAYWKHVYHILPPFGRVLLSFYRTFQPQRVEGYTLVNDFHQAMSLCLNYAKPQAVWDLGSRDLLVQSLKKASRQELENLVLELSSQKDQITKQRDARIQELFRIIGKITWDKNFTPEKLETSPNDPFQELFIATSLLQQDVFDMVEELKELNLELENKVDVRTLALKEKETNLRNILDNNDKVIVLLNTRLAVKDFNKRYADLYFSKTGQQPRYHSPFLETFFQGEEERNTWKARLEKTLASGNAGEYLEGRIENGVESFFETKIFPILEGNVPIGLTFFSVDITDKVQFERRLKLQNEELIKVNHELDKFVYSISHDLRAPLTSAMALINLARAEPNPEMFQTYLNLQEKSLKKLDAFIMDVLNLSKNSRLELQKEPIDLKDMVEDIYEEYLFDEEGKQVEKRLSITVEGPVVSDKTRIRIVLHNLINNAIRYARPQEGGSYVEVIATNYPGNMIQLLVKDNGTGIDPLHINHIFNMFYRATSQKHGSGLGLYIVREITNKMGGIVRVKSEISKGSTFEVLIPNMVATALSRVNA